jgi:hypothetical protein
MGMWRVRGRINPKTQVQKPNPGAPSASLKVVGHPPNLRPLVRSALVSRVNSVLPEFAESSPG